MLLEAQNYSREHAFDWRMDSWLVRGKPNQQPSTAANPEGLGATVEIDFYGQPNAGHIGGGCVLCNDEDTLSDEEKKLHAAIHQSLQQAQVEAIGTQLKDSKASIDR